MGLFFIGHFLLVVYARVANYNNMDFRWFACNIRRKLARVTIAINNDGTYHCTLRHHDQVWCFYRPKRKKKKSHKKIIFSAHSDDLQDKIKNFTYENNQVTANQIPDVYCFSPLGSHRKNDQVRSTGFSVIPAKIIRC